MSLWGKENILKTFQTTYMIWQVFMIPCQMLLFCEVPKH